MIHTLYRISDGSQLKDKLSHATKLHCLRNYIEVFGLDGLIIFADNCKEETIFELRKFTPNIISIALGNALAWRFCAEYALDNLHHEDLVYFVEDDYLHLRGSKSLIGEGLEIADYISLYDHPDKYIASVEGGPNPFVSGKGEQTQVMISQSSHWKTTNSTTMTFATKVKTLREDKEIWWKYTEKWPLDYQIFWELCGYEPVYQSRFRKKYYQPKRTLITPIPSKATHIETKWLAPFIDWGNI